MLAKVKSRIKENLPALLSKSLNAAAAEQKLTDIRSLLEKLVPDISEQYSEFKITDHYTEIKVRNMHAFQISLVKPVIDEFDQPVIVDIGDSAGTHLQYLLGLYQNGKKMRCL